MWPLLSVRFLLTASLMTLIAVLAYQWLPKKRFEVFPGAVNQLYVFYDGQGQGASRGHFDAETGEAVCEVIPSNVYPFCGVIASLGDGVRHGLDFSGYEGLRVAVKYSGPSPRLRLSVRHFQPGFSKAGQVSTAKFQSFNIAVEDLARTAYVSLEDLAVAEWWIAESGVPREMSQPDFSNVIRVGLDLPDPVAFGRHEFEIVRLELEGDWVTEKQWYLGILLFWLIVVALLVVRQNSALRKRLARDRRHLDELVASAGGAPAATRDALTGALSRAGLAQVAGHYQDAQGRTTRRYALALIDLDGFDRLNRRGGYDAAGQLLVSVANLVRERTRSSDLLCRWADDKFALFSPDASADELRVAAEDILERVRARHFEIDGLNVKITASAGIAESSEQRRFEDTFHLANQALMTAKSAGKSQVRQG